MAATDSAGRTVSTQMLYNLNPSAIQSSVHLKTINCDGTNVYTGGLNSKIVFTVPHIPGGEYWDPSMSRFRCRFRLHVPVHTTGSPGSKTIVDNADEENEINHPIFGVWTPDNMKLEGSNVAPQNTLSTLPLGEGGYVDGIRFERGVESIIRSVLFYVFLPFFDVF